MFEGLQPSDPDYNEIVRHFHMIQKDLRTLKDEGDLEFELGGRGSSLPEKIANDVQALMDLVFPRRTEATEALTSRIKKRQLAEKVQFRVEGSEDRDAYSVVGGHRVGSPFLSPLKRVRDWLQSRDGKGYIDDYIESDRMDDAEAIATELGVDLKTFRQAVHREAFRTEASVDEFMMGNPYHDGPTTGDISDQHRRIADWLKSRAGKAFVAEYNRTGKFPEHASILRELDVDRDVFGKFIAMAASQTEATDEDHRVAKERAQQDAYEEGAACGADSRCSAADNPYPSASDSYFAWDAGYADGARPGRTPDFEDFLRSN